MSNLKLNFELEEILIEMCEESFTRSIETKSKPKNLMDVVLELTILIEEGKDFDGCLPHAPKSSTSSSKPPTTY